MKYHNITTDDMLNGDGLRVVLWVSGCNHKCKGCHNPVTWDCNDGIEFDENAKNEIFHELEKDYIEGITFSGGDPLHPANVETITLLAKEIAEKYPDKNMWLYTGGSWKNVIADSKANALLPYIKVMVDGEFVQDKADVTLLWKGSSNQKVIDVQATLANDNKENPVLYCGDYE